MINYWMIVFISCHISLLAANTCSYVMH